MRETRTHRKTMQEQAERYAAEPPQSLEAVKVTNKSMVKGVTAKIHVDPQACPRFCKPRSVPFAMKQKVEEELERLLKEGIIEPVQFSE